MRCPISGRRGCCGGGCWGCMRGFGGGGGRRWRPWRGGMWVFVFGGGGGCWGGGLGGRWAYWRERLGGAPVLEVPTDRPRPAVRSSAGGLVSVCVPAGTVAGLRQVAREVGASMFMTLLSGFAVLLGRYAGSVDVLVGTPVA